MTNNSPSITGYHSITRLLGAQKKESHLIVAHSGTISVRSLSRSVSQLRCHRSALLFEGTQRLFGPKDLRNFQDLGSILRCLWAEMSNDDNDGGPGTLIVIHDDPCLRKKNVDRISKAFHFSQNLDLKVRWISPIRIQWHLFCCSYLQVPGLQLASWSQVWSPGTIKNIHLGYQCAP